MYFLYITAGVTYIKRMVDTKSIAETRVELSRLVEAAHFRSEPTVITKNGDPRAVLVPYAEWLAEHPQAASSEPKG